MSSTDATLRHQEDARSRVDSALGMVFFVGSWSMAFGTLFLSFMVLRQRVGVWPPPGVELPSFGIAVGGTAVLLVSSVLIHRAVGLTRKGASSAASTWGLGLALGLAFAGVQTWLWADLLARGSAPTAGVYESLFFGLTWIHAAHVAVALAALIFIQVGLSTGRYGAHRLAAVQNVAIFWQFMDVVWVILFAGIFVF
jgi:cytochrome c oxidase subunit 3